jgi:RNA polymerase sigma factor (TIGR02999 family)
LAGKSRVRNVTELLRAWSAGDEEARDRLVPLVYDELRRQAAGRIRRERANDALRPTELVHETYLRLAGQRRPVWKNRAQFFAVASEIMRRMLVDRARARQTAKRSGRWARVAFDDARVAAPSVSIDVLDLDDALTRLAAFDKRKSRIAELRFFGGLSLEETGETLGVSLTTVEREWQVARAWLFASMSGNRAPGTPRSRVRS